MNKIRLLGEHDMYIIIYAWVIAAARMFIKGSLK